MATSLITPPIFATGDFVEASWANDLRDNFLLLDDRTGEDPGASGKVLVSNGSLTAAWTTPGESNQITAPKVSKAGDAMTGSIGFVGNNIGVVFGGNGQLRDQTSGTQETQLFGNGDRVVVYRESGANAMLTITNTLATFVAAIAATVGTFSGAISAASAAIAGAITGASLTTSGGISSTGGNISATAGTGTFNALVSSTTVTGGTDVVKGTTSLGRIAKGSYSGNNVDGRQIVTGWAPRKVEIYVKTGSTLYAVAHVYSTSTNTTILHAFNGTSSFVSVSENTVLSASNGFLVDASGQNALNVSGNTYQYIAYE